MRAGGPTGSGSNSSTVTAAQLLSVSYLMDNHVAIPRLGSKIFSSKRGIRSGSRLLRTRSPRLHGAVELLGCAMGSGLLTLKNGFCG
jgi:hypothetical protein